jgi:LemA protein
MASNPGLTLAAVIIISALVLLGGCLIAAYNRFVAVRNRVDQAFATIDVMLKQRYDLVPNLVACVKGYLKHENATLTELTALRAKALSGVLSPDESVDAGVKAGHGLGRIMIASEAYPQLRASDNFITLQRSLNEIEEQLAAARRAFNAAVTEYNNSVETFPGNLAAAIFGFRPRKLFETAKPERPAPNVAPALSTYAAARSQ